MYVCVKRFLLVNCVAWPQVGREGLCDSELLNTYSKSGVILNLSQRAAGVFKFFFFFYFFPFSLGRMLLRHLHSSPRPPCWEGRNPLSPAVTLSRLPAAVQALPSRSVPSPRALCAGQVHRLLPPQRSSCLRGQRCPSSQNLKTTRFSCAF